MRVLGLSALVVALMGMSGGAFAGGEAKKKAPEAAKPAEVKAEVKPVEKAPEEPKAPMVAPTPSPELEKVKLLAANWNCAGTGTDPSGAALTYKSSFKGKADLKKHWVAVTYDQKKSKTNPIPFQGKGFIGYDAGTRKFVFFGADDMGGMINLTSTGWDAAGTALVFTGNGSGMGQTMPFRMTFTKGATEKQLTFTIEVSMQGKFMKVSEDACKK